MNSEKIIEEATTYINNDKTVEETAKELGISKRTFQIHLKQLGEVDPFLESLVLKKKESNMKAGRVMGGQIGKATVRYTREEANKIANGIIADELTYEEAAKKYGIPKSTIYEMVHSDFVSISTKSMLDAVAISNKRNMMASGLIGRYGK